MFASEHTPGQQLTISDEIALYDRQIRLWGVQAQEKIRNANILLINLRGLATEVAKNLVLAGIKSITVLDSAVVTEEDLGCQFFLTEASVGSNRAEAAAPQIRNLNPRVNVVVDTSDISSKSPSFFADFTVVIVTDQHPDTLNVLNTATRLHNVPFYAASLQGMYGTIFADLISHEFVISREASNIPTKVGPETRTRTVVSAVTRKEGGKNVEMVTKRELYSTFFLASDIAQLPSEIVKSPRRKRAVTPLLSCFRALWQFETLHGGKYPSPTSHADIAAFTTYATNCHRHLGLPAETLKSGMLRGFLQNLGSEIAPVAAIVGGWLSQDVINVLGQRQQPLQNFVFFDGSETEAPVYALHPDGELGDGLLPVSDAMINGTGPSAPAAVTASEAIKLD